MNKLIPTALFATVIAGQGCATYTVGISENTVCSDDGTCKTTRTYHDSTGEVPELIINILEEKLENN